MDKVQYGNFKTECPRAACKWIGALYGLMEQDQPMARIKCNDAYEVRNAYVSLTNSINRKNLPVTVMRRGNFVYLIKKDVQ